MRIIWNSRPLQIEVLETADGLVIDWTRYVNEKKRDEFAQSIAKGPYTIRSMGNKFIFLDAKGTAKSDDGERPGGS